MEKDGTGTGTFLFLSHPPMPPLTREPSTNSHLSLLTESSLFPGEEHVLLLPSHLDSHTHPPTHDAGQGSMP